MENSAKNKEISGQKYKRTQTWNISAIIDAFLDQKRVNVCEHAVMMVPHGTFKNTRIVPSLLRVHIHLLSSDRKRHSHCRNIFVFMCTFIRRSFHFLVSFPIYFEKVDVIFMILCMHGPYVWLGRLK